MRILLFKMENNQMLFKDVDLNNYLSGPINQQNEIDKLNKEIENLSNLEKELTANSFSIERLPLERLHREIKPLESKRKKLFLSSKYQTLDLSFLRMSNQVNFEGKTLQLPKFSVYHLNNLEFSISFLRGIDQTYGFFWRKFKINKGEIIAQFFDLPKIFSDYLSKSLEFNQLRHINAASMCYYTNVPEELISKYCPGKDSNNRFRIGTIFNGLLPAETHRKIIEARGEKEVEVYIIAETKPEHWTRVLPTKDPLAVGVFEDKCYLIDHFNTTPLEDYVKKEFTS